MLMQVQEQRAALGVPPPGQQPHGGAVEPAEPISKHPMDITGRLPGGGSMVSQNVPGSVQ
jgi:hypothetical protein